MKLTPPQRRFLEAAEQYSPPGEFDGTGARGSKRRCAARLVELGLVRYVGHGLSEDGDPASEREVPIYAITDAGRALLSESVDR